jgi:hypothetical protein
MTMANNAVLADLNSVAPEVGGTAVPEGEDADPDADTLTEVALNVTDGTPNTAVELYSAVIAVPFEHRSDVGVTADSFTKRT